MNLCELFDMRSRSYRYDDSRWPELIGIELELEEATIQSAPPYWVLHEDASLRNGIELVLDAPYAGEVLGNAIREYYNSGIAHNSTSRTSTHIHINMTDATLDNLRSMFMIMYSIEDALFNAVGESRKWSGYAMALGEMEPSRVRGILTSEDRSTLVESISPSRNQERYYGFNTCMRRHGTAEFRYFPGGPTRQELESWVDFVVNVKQIAKKWAPAQLIDFLTSDESMRRFVTENFSDYWSTTLLRHDSITNMFGKFCEVAAHVTQANGPDRRENLVFVTNGLVKYISNFLNKEGVDYIKQVAKDLSVMTESEWQYHAAKAAEFAIMHQESAPKLKAKVPARVGDTDLPMSYEDTGGWGTYTTPAPTMPDPYASATPRVPPRTTQSPTRRTVRTPTFNPFSS